MTGDVKHVALNSETDFSAVAEAVCPDKPPRAREQDGRPIAALVSIEDLERLMPKTPSAVLSTPTPEGIQRALNAAGAWKDLDIDGDDLIEKIYGWRRESPPSDPVVW